MRSEPKAGRRRPRLAALLTRPLAEDDERAAFWVRHVRLGVVLSEFGAVIVGAYALGLSDERSGHLLLLAVVVGLTTPLVLLLPIIRIVRSPRGALFFYAWTTALVSTISIASVLDGGAASPLVLMLFMPLTFAALAYPPAGVALTGCGMLLAYLAVATTGAPPRDQLLVMTSVLTLFTAMSAWVSANQWLLYDRQQLLARRLTLLATVDPLTGCLNRAAFRAELEQLVSQSGAAAPLTICVLDLDGFKQVNDTHGHRAGDDVLIAVTAALRAAARPGDVVGRLGGDEFAVLLPGCADAVAAALVARLTSAVATAAAPHDVTASAGTATSREPRDDVDALLELADRYMYDAKVLSRRARLPAPRQAPDDVAEAAR